jgi:hypothetical protein
VLCNESGRLNAAQFEAAMRHQLRQYAGRRISDFLYHGRGGEAEHAQVKGKKVAEAVIESRTGLHRVLGTRWGKEFEMKDGKICVQVSLVQREAKGERFKK